MDARAVLRILLASWAGLAIAQVPTLPDVPANLPAGLRQPLLARHAQLQAQRATTLDTGTLHNQRCRSVEQGSNLERECLASRERLTNEIRALSTAVDRLEDDIVAAEATRALIARFAGPMTALARQLGWSSQEITRLDAALWGLDTFRRLDADQIRRTWQAIQRRDTSGDLARAASSGEGPGFPVGAGQQSFQDCTIFALANAAGVPYGIVATRATALIRQGEWRSAAARANPQHEIEQSGLFGAEVVMLAESLGQAEVVSHVDFARTLREGRRLLLNVVPQDGSMLRGHQVVLTKTFLHRGEPWFEMVDSNQPAQRRLYVSDAELNAIVRENGIAFRSEPGSTPRLLR